MLDFEYTLIYVASLKTEIENLFGGYWFFMLMFMWMLFLQLLLWFLRIQITKIRAIIFWAPSHLLFPFLDNAPICLHFDYFIEIPAIFHQVPSKYVQKYLISQDFTNFIDYDATHTLGAFSLPL